VLGTRQTGDMQFKIAELLRDAPLLPQVQRGGEQLMRDYPELSQQIVIRWLGENRRYFTV